METNCPNCGSNQTQSREMIHKIGTSVGSGSGIYRGVSFGRRSGIVAGIGASTHSNTRQSLLARESAPASIFAPLFLVVLAFIFGSKELGFMVIFCWALIAFVINKGYKKEWLCKKCGAKFIPYLIKTAPDAPAIIEVNNTVVKNEASTPEIIQSKKIHIKSADGKSCSICGGWFQKAEFSYGNKDNRSYCQQCNKEEKMAYTQGGVEAARKYKKEKRESWANS